PRAGRMSIRILIADDQALVRAGFRMILDAEDDLDVIGEAADGLQAIEQARRLKPDVVLMDIRMPELDGIEATRRVLAAAGDDDPVRVLMLTTFDLNEYVYEALRAGASGFLLKDVPPEQLAAGIRVVAGGEALLAPSITKPLIQEFAAARPVAPAPPPGGPCGRGRPRTGAGRAPGRAPASRSSGRSARTRGRGRSAPARRRRRRGPATAARPTC